MDKRITEIPLFSGLNSQQLSILNDITYVNDCSEGEILFLEGEPADALYVILDGEVKIIKVTAEGKEIILETMGKGDFFGEMGILEEKNRSATALINKKTKLLVLEKGNFIRFIKAYPEIALKMIVELSHRLRQANQEIEGLAFLDVKSRLKRLLLRLAKKSDGVGLMEIAREITHQEMAKYIGSSRETVTRLLNRLETEGIIEVQENKIVLKNMERW